MKSKDTLILEKAYQRVLEANSNWGDEAVEQSIKSTTPDVAEMAEEYINHVYQEDQGWGKGMREAKTRIPVIEAELAKKMGQEWLDKLKELANAELWRAEYGDVSQEEIDSRRKELGLPIDEE